MVAAAAPPKGTRETTWELKVPQRSSAEVQSTTNGDTDTAVDVPRSTAPAGLSAASGVVAPIRAQVVYGLSDAASIWAPINDLGIKEVGKGCVVETVMKEEPVAHVLERGEAVTMAGAVAGACEEAGEAGEAVEKVESDGNADVGQGRRGAVAAWGCGFFIPWGALDCIYSTTAQPRLSELQDYVCANVLFWGYLTSGELREWRFTDFTEGR